MLSLCLFISLCKALELEQQQRRSVESKIIMYYRLFVFVCKYTSIDMEILFTDFLYYTELLIFRLPMRPIQWQSQLKTLFKIVLNLLHIAALHAMPSIDSYTYILLVNVLDFPFRPHRPRPRNMLAHSSPLFRASPLPRMPKAAFNCLRARECWWVGATATICQCEPDWAIGGRNGTSVCGWGCVRVRARTED